MMIIREQKSWGLAMPGTQTSHTDGWTSGPGVRTQTSACGNLVMKLNESGRKWACFFLKHPIMIYSQHIQPIHCADMHTRTHTRTHILICLGVLLFLNEILPCSSAWPQILYPPASTSQVQGWQACHHQDVSNQYIWHQLAPVLAKQYDQKFDVGGGQKFLALGFTLNSFFYVEMFNSKKCFHRHMFSMCLGNGHITEKINFMKMFQ